MTAPDAEPSDRLSLQAAAHLLQVSDRTLRRWTLTFSMPHALEEGDLVFSRRAILEWADGHSMRLAAEMPTQEDEDRPLPTLLEAIRRGGIHRDVRGTSVDTALEHAAKAMQLPAEIDRDFFHQVLLAREDLDSTGMGEGIAVPHVRAPLVLHVDEAYVALVFLEHPVDWHAVDGKPVDTLFVLASPGIRSHLHLLRRIAIACHDPALRELLLERGPDEAIEARLTAIASIAP
ncbi:MAG: PTS sugar transporter subunit IIA [Planctomycetes bacterium]|nr:PTS sugar transporter subunit IIA [Planctomycetota bacterium]MCB9920453.1 PTS sugar transporter subunit IIA [Planctomycetota bacterium]